MAKLSQQILKNRYVYLANIGYIKVLKVFNSGKMLLDDGSIVACRGYMVIQPQGFNPPKKYIIKPEKGFIQKHELNYPHLKRTLAVRDSRFQRSWKKLESIFGYVAFIVIAFTLIAVTTKIMWFLAVSIFFTLFFILFFSLDYAKKY